MIPSSSSSSSFFSKRDDDGDASFVLRRAMVVVSSVDVDGMASCSTSVTTEMGEARGVLALGSSSTAPVPLLRFSLSEEGATAVVVCDMARVGRRGFGAPSSSAIASFRSSWLVVVGGTSPSTTISISSRHGRDPIGSSS